MVGTMLAIVPANPRHPVVLREGVMRVRAVDAGDERQ
jgi:hypothetical protein